MAAARAEGVVVADPVVGEAVDCPDNSAEDEREQESTVDALVDSRVTGIGIAAVESCSGGCSEPSAEAHSGSEIEHSGLLPCKSSRRRDGDRS